MEDMTKGALVGGGIVAIIGAIVSFVTYKEGGVNGLKKGLAKGVGLRNEKFKSLTEQNEELQAQIQMLKEFKKKAECARDSARSIAAELYNCLKERQLINDELHNKLINDLWLGKVDGFSEMMGKAINATQEASNVINGGPGNGVLHFSDFSGVRISFSDDISGTYKIPPCTESILPPDAMLMACPKLLEKVKSLIPGWRFEYREAPVAPVEPMACAETPWLQAESISNVSAVNLSQRIERQLRSLNESRFDVRQTGVLSRGKYDYECICRNALRDLDGQYVPCDKVEFKKDSFDVILLSVREEESEELDFKNGIVTSKWLDDYIVGKCNEIKCAISAFWTLLSDSDKESITKNQFVLDSIAKKQPISGSIVLLGDSPYVRFSDDICIRLYIPDLEIYFEGDGFNVRTNDDLRRALHKLVPDWTDMPVSDSRILEMLSSFRENSRVLAAWQGGGRQKPPAEGAIRQFLRFKDAAKMLCDKVLHDMVGKQIACQTVELKRVDGVVSETSLAHCSEVEKMLRDAVASVQEELNVLARSRNAVLYCYGDLFPELKTHRYYEKWWAFDKAANIPQLRVGDIVNGVVSNIKEYGAFIDFSGTSGLLHISEISNVFIKDINTFLKIGQSVEVKIIGIDAAKGRISLSMKQLKKS